MIELSVNLKKMVRELRKSQPETFYHSLRVKNLTAKMLYEMGRAGAASYGEQEVNSICEGALLHDIGKLALKNALLTKPTSLEQDEMDHLRQHTRLGAELVERELEGEDKVIVSNICRLHHERIDGSGYEGITSLPLYVQIVAACDVFDALHSDRVYHRRLRLEDAFWTLREGGCGQFAPDLLRFLKQAVLTGEEDWTCGL